jgi:hypothetical protein
MGRKPREIKQMKTSFNISDDTMVVTSKYVTGAKLPVLEVSHEDDEESGSLWQFHCGNGDYAAEKMQLVRLDTILKIDPLLINIASLKMGQTARRSNLDSPWVIDC